MFVVPEAKRLVHAGQRFNRWAVLGATFYLGSKNWQHVVCECNCGKTRIVRVADLTSGKHASCGCSRKKQDAYSRTRIYHIWAGMHDRCRRKNNESYANYGGRGISVCAEWLDFLTFRAWALSNGYTASLTIERINNDGNYEPANCTWATRAEQKTNQRNTIWITAFGERKPLIKWVQDARCVVGRCALHSRVTRNKSRWTPEAAITTPVIPRGKRYIA